MPMIAGAVPEARLRAHVAALEGVRHPDTAPLALAAAEEYVAHHLAALAMPVRRPAFRHHGTEYRNVVATLEGSEPALPRLLVGAHFDSAHTTPGADDKASGVAALLEVARFLTPRGPMTHTVEFVGFNLEEVQRGLPFRVGSRAFAQPGWKLSTSRSWRVCRRR